jgi:hypothetical protein
VIAGLIFLAKALTSGLLHRCHTLHGERQAALALHVSSPNPRLCLPAASNAEQNDSTINLIKFSAT